MAHIQRHRVAEVDAARVAPLDAAASWERVRVRVLAVLRCSDPASLKQTEGVSFWSLRRPLTGPWFCTRVAIA